MKRKRNESYQSALDIQPSTPKRTATKSTSLSLRTTPSTCIAAVSYIVLLNNIRQSLHHRLRRFLLGSQSTYDVIDKDDTDVQLLITSTLPQCNYTQEKFREAIITTLNDAVSVLNLTDSIQEFNKRFMNALNESRNARVRHGPSGPQKGATYEIPCNMISILNRTNADIQVIHVDDWVVDPMDPRTLTDTQMSNADYETQARLLNKDYLNYLLKKECNCETFLEEGGATNVWSFMKHHTDLKGFVVKPVISEDREILFTYKTKHLYNTELDSVFDQRDVKSLVCSDIVIQPHKKLPDGKMVCDKPSVTSYTCTRPYILNTKTLVNHDPSLEKGPIGVVSYYLSFVYAWHRIYGPGNDIWAVLIRRNYNNIRSSCKMDVDDNLLLTIAWMFTLFQRSAASISGTKQKTHVLSSNTALSFIEFEKDSRIRKQVAFSVIGGTIQVNDLAACASLLRDRLSHYTIGYAKYVSDTRGEMYPELLYLKVVVNLN